MKNAIWPHLDSILLFKNEPFHQQTIYGKPLNQNMNYHTSTRIPVNDDYASILGKAVYIFAYYEWTIIYIIENLNAGFVSEYSRPRNSPLTSGAVRKKFKTVINQISYPINGVNKTELDNCYDHFNSLIDKRNALRVSPASKGQKPEAEILMIDWLSPSCATVKIRIRAHNNVFVDHLGFVNGQDGWQIVSKIWHLEKVID